MNSGCVSIWAIALQQRERDRSQKNAGRAGKIAIGYGGAREQRGVRWIEKEERKGNGTEWRGEAFENSRKRSEETTKKMERNGSCGQRGVDEERLER